MLEGVSREAGPFEFVVRADGARVPRTVRAWAGGCARGPVDDGARGAGAVRAGPFAGGLNPLMRSWALLVAVWAARLGYHLWG